LYNKDYLTRELLLKKNVRINAVDEAWILSGAFTVEDFMSEDEDEPAAGWGNKDGEPADVEGADVCTGRAEDARGSWSRPQSNCWKVQFFPSNKEWQFSNKKWQLLYIFFPKTTNNRQARCPKRGEGLCRVVLKMLQTFVC
jgi:hypothetical protein